MAYEQTPQAKEWVPVREAARRLGVSRDTVRRRIRAGRLQGRQEPRPGGFRWLVLVEEPEEEGAEVAPPLEALDATGLRMLVEQLTGERDYLRQALAAALSKVPQLPPPEPKASSNRLATVKRPWWRFWQRRF